jgi:hypothetical protein
MFAYSSAFGQSKTIVPDQNSISKSSCGGNFSNYFKMSGPPDHSGPSMDETDSLLAKTMNQLSIKERDEALHDLHGVADVSDEKPEFIVERLKKLDEELEKIKSKKAYYIAKSISLNYVSNNKMRLQFLRADNYDAKNAATRLVAFFESKLELFGKEMLTKDILLSDFSKQDIADVERGYLHLLPQRDRAGRAIICTIGALAATISVETRVRMLLALASVLDIAFEVIRLKLASFLLLIFAASVFDVSLLHCCPRKGDSDERRCDNLLRSRAK